MKKFHFLFTASVLLALASIFSCSSGDDNEYDYCVYDSTQKCLFGPFTTCQSDGLLSNSCPYQNQNPTSSSSITTGGGTSSSGGGGSSSSVGGGISSSSSGSTPPATAHSLDGVWDDGYEWEYTISGSTGVFSKIGSASGAQLDAINKGHVALGGQRLRNITSTGNLTWSGQILTVTSNTSSPNIATGTRWGNVTITMSADGQTIYIVYTTTTNGNVTEAAETWTRKW